MRSPVVVLVAAALGGCATVYQPLESGPDPGEGYSETRLGPNTFQVSFLGNNATNRERATDFTLLRAAEICVASGYRYFVITSSQELAPRTLLSAEVQERTDNPANVFGLSAENVSTTTYRGAPRANWSRPRPSVVIGLLTEIPAGDFGEVYDAQLLIGEIVTKYAIETIDAAASELASD